MAFDYCAWSTWLDEFAVGRDTTPSHLGAMESSIGAGAASQLATRVAEAVQQRMRLWSRTLLRDTRAARSVTDVEHVLTAARARLRPIAGLCALGQLMPELREELQRAVGESLERVQKDLEDDQRRSRLAGNEDLLRALRRFDLAAAFRSHVAASAAAPATPLGVGPHVGTTLNGRRILC